MPIYHCPSLVTKEQYAKMTRVQLRTINDQIRKNTLSQNFKLATIDGDHYIINPFEKIPLPPNMKFEHMEWVRNFAARNKMFYERVYEEIIKGTISGYVIGNRIYINKTEPQVMEYAANYKRRNKEPNRI